MWHAAYRRRQSHLVPARGQRQTNAPPTRAACGHTTGGGALEYGGAAVEGARRHADANTPELASLALGLQPTGLRSMLSSCSALHPLSLYSHPKQYNAVHPTGLRSVRHTSATRHATGWQSHAALYFALHLTGLNCVL